MSALMTDKYELTMLQAALADGTANRKAVFELFNRKFLPNRPHNIVAGTQRAIDTILNFRFTPEDIEYLAGHLNQQTLDYLADYRFEGNVIGYREGDYFFPYSPVLTIETTFGAGVILETVLLSIMNYDSAVASTATAFRRAAGPDITLQELGSRRVNETSAVVAARAAYIAGWNGTSNLFAGKEWGVPVYGTSAHAFTLAHETEVAAFASQINAMGVGTTLLVDTYDIPTGISNAIAVAGTELGAIRIDSGHPETVITAAREQLNSLGAFNTRIVFSGDVDLELIRELNSKGTPVDAYGIGSSVVTGEGRPNCGFVYKLVEMEYADGEMHPVAKKANGKASLGGKKTVVREMHNGKFVQERIISDINGEDVNVIPGSRFPQVKLIENGVLVNHQTVEGARELHEAQLGMNPGMDYSIQ